MKPNPHNPYGYKVCYQEKGSSVYIRYFLTYTYKAAVSAMQGYIRYPPYRTGNGQTTKSPALVHLSRYTKRSSARDLAGVSVLGHSRLFLLF